METSSVARGSKTRKACDLCRVRKIRCDRAQPACENCHLAGLPCIFTPPLNQERKDLRQELADTQARVRELEDALNLATQSSSHENSSQLTASTLSGRGVDPASTSQIPFTSSVIPDTRSLEAAVATFKWHIANCGLGSPLSSARAAFSSSVHQQTGHKFDLDELLFEVAHSFEAQGFRSNKRLTTSQWPPRHLVQSCIDYYAKSGLYSMFPFADVEALQILLNADVLSRPQATRAANIACLAAFTANIAQMHRHEPSLANADPDSYAQAALGLIPAILMETPDLRTLEAVIMLAIYIAPIGQTQSIDLLLGIAIQTVYSLGGHRIQATPGTPSRSQENQHLRALFWLCYGMDSELCIRKGQPQLINEAHCDMDLPVNYALKSKEHHFYWKPLSSKELLYPSDLRLNLIKTRIQTMLYSEKNAPNSEARRLQLIRELDNELSKLRSEFPVECRPDLFATEGAPNYLFHDLSIRGVSIHLEYYYCLGKIHGSNNSYNIPVSNSGPPLLSSTEITYEAARCTLIYIGRVRHYINYHTFWIHAHFLLTAVITLFRFLITAPTAPTFARDLRIIDDTAQIFAQFTVSDDPERNCFPPFYITYHFVKRLSFLAHESQIRSMTERRC
ncbi:transcriptional regulator family: Fungal Specific TF [Penicillium longicatenatum]|uniref:transcriptional regulator family: Fungal Specific TF n=1 Tax=Penicillium longicatenatum TaxID=1561947 RepID=UPI002546D9E0|nr:transcriptional regulator family: Fungal Specific TF [Penicillium longicatenatum]KAJ5657213.1 transcriptional regulator family: Fungal Specific TF [Penicillium longicatenatum]